MEMDGLDSNCSTHNSIAKGKRTKRMRLLTPCGGVVAATAVTSSTSSANSGASSTTTYQSEEEDMANCLILLARGGESHHQHKEQLVQDHHALDNCDAVIKTEKGNSNNTITAANNNKVGFYIYECKTCNRSFPSFQALGGHRASHKKPKLGAEEKKRQLPPSSPPRFQLQHKCELFEEEGNVKSGPPISLKLGNGNSNKGKIHECSICGSEFTSGQALGGHMRRHRASTNTNTNTKTNTVFEATSCNTPQPRNILQLDLNLPAPEDDLRETKFQFPTTTQVLIGTPALVDCHY